MGKSFSTKPILDSKKELKKPIAHNSNRIFNNPKIIIEVLYFDNLIITPIYYIASKGLIDKVSNPLTITACTASNKLNLA